MKIPPDEFAQQQINLAKEKFPCPTDQLGILTAIGIVAELMLKLGPTKGKFVLEIANATVANIES